ncbi:GntR family transcriptional regulator [Jannaschia sp. Os4]|uniref:GntR family transcriptional regulator n=1 Tax=Jannaschia sp. Os4 TaxID=2807617 RepID=UPI001939BCC3|nr:GntR family transcriptional regulator [Jannaschia sp. Os4]MBM2576280.1 GntR family transcriptional regulator [Jannaschia sp. Os4]
MAMIEELTRRRTSADIVFERLYADIMSLRLMPGAKMSEVEVAERFGVSRQPVRDAFARLGKLDLLLVRPQRATRVRRFSHAGIAAARFVRLALELETVGRATARWDGAMVDRFADCIAAQRAAVASEDPAAFVEHDNAFHGLLSEAAGAAFSFGLVMEKKGQVDRICMLSLKEADGMRVLIGDHEDLLAAMDRGDPEGARAVLRRHLERIEPTLAAISERHRAYFEP